MTRTSNEHPSWCERGEDSVGMLRHRSKQVRVGARWPINARGEVSAWLLSTNGGPAWVVVNVAHMIGVTAEISLDDAAELRDGLTELLRQADYKQNP